jgi:hypothetical protein
MAWHLDVDGTERSSIVLRTTLRAGGQAFEGQVGTGGGFDLDDNAAAITLPGRVRWTLTDDEDDVVLARGRIGPKGIGRGPMPMGDARSYDVQLDDGNTHLYGIVVDQWERPEESDYARVQALAAAFLSGSGSTSPKARDTTDLDATTYVPNTHTVTMEAKTYDATNPAGVLGDCKRASGKEFFVTVGDELFYDIPTSTAYASGLAITDNPSAGTDKVPIWEDGPPLNQDPSELLSGGVGIYGTAQTRIADSRSAVEAAHDKWETAVYLDAETSGQANLELDTLLDNQGVEEERFECVILVPTEQLGMIKYGQTISFRAAAAATLSPRVLRIGRLMWEMPGAEGAPYKAHLELGFPKKVVPRIRKGTKPPPNVVSVPPTPPGPDFDNAEVLQTNRKSNTRAFTASNDVLTSDGWHVVSASIGAAGSTSDAATRDYGGDWSRYDKTKSWMIIEWDPADIRPTHCRLRGRVFVNSGVGLEDPFTGCSVSWQIQLVPLKPNGWPFGGLAGATLVSGSQLSWATASPLDDSNTTTYDVIFRVSDPDAGKLALLFVVDLSSSVPVFQIGAPNDTDCTTIISEEEAPLDGSEGGYPFDPLPGSGATWHHDIVIAAAHAFDLGDLNPDTDGMTIELLGVGTLDPEEGAEIIESLGLGDGSAVRTTTKPYKPLTLMVWVDGEWQPVTEIDPATGSFTLGFIPDDDEVTDVRYVAA